jgi:formate dehydrogenase major subunit
MMFPDYRLADLPDVRQRFENARGTTPDPDKGLTVVEIMDAIHAGQKFKFCAACMQILEVA